MNHIKHFRNIMKIDIEKNYVSKRALSLQAFNTNNYKVLKFFSMSTYFFDE